MIKTLAAFGILGAIGAFGFIATQKAPLKVDAGSNVQVATSKPGNNPGNVRQDPLNLVKAAKSRGNEVAQLAGGCFWCTEGDFRQVKGIVATAVGYAQGHKENPTYEEVCTKTTGHAEVFLLEFNPKVITYEQVLRKFFEVHDPTTLNRQGPDVGPQYRSGIYFLDESQKKVAEKVKADLTAKKTFKFPIVTEILPAARFWMAEEYHQQYYEK
jgi:peptide-methionine (S)-S-oxide reductase